MRPTKVLTVPWKYSHKVASNYIVRHPIRALCFIIGLSCSTVLTGNSGFAGSAMLAADPVRASSESVHRGGDHAPRNVSSPIRLPSAVNVTAPVADWYVDQSVSSSGDGMSPVTAFKTILEATMAATGGDTIFVAGGQYREEVNFSGLSGKSTKERTRIVGDATDPFVITGGETLEGLEPCSADDEPVVGTNWASMYKATVDTSLLPANDPRAANISENGKQLPISLERADKSDDFFLTQPTAYHIADTTITANGLVFGFRKPSVTDRYTKAQIENARVYLVAEPNIGVDSLIARFEKSTDTIYLSETSWKYESSALRDRFALENLLPAMKKGEYGYVDHGDGTVTIYLWPNDPANVAAGLVEYSSRNIGINLSGESHIEMFHFEVRQIAGTSIVNGPIISRRGHSRDIYLHHFEVSDCLQVQGSYALVHMKDVDDVHMHDFKLTRGQGYYGIFLQGSAASRANDGHPEYVDHATGAYLHHFHISYTSLAPIRLYTQRDAVVAFGTIEDSAKEAHGNTMNAYEGCYNTLFWGINAHNADGYITWQESDSTVIAFVAASASRAVSGGARAIYSQQNSVPKPGSVHGWLGSYLLNTRGVPNGDGLTYQNGLKASSNSETNDKWTVYNNIYHGHSAETFDNVVEWDHNINTNGAAVGPKDRSVAAVTLYQDPAKEDFSYPLASPARTFKAKDWSTLFPEFQDRWPNFDGWDKDMVGAPIDWTNPPIGPTVDLDAEIGNRPFY